MKNKICIDPGHGGTAVGAVFKGLLEKDVNLGVALVVKDELSKLSGDYFLYLTRTFDRDVNLQERCNLANEKDCDLFISIHCNADPDDDSPGMPEAKGEEIWYNKDSEEGKAFAKVLAKQVDDIFPQEPFRGIKESNSLYVLKHTNMPAVLIEIGFIDKSDSVEAFSDQKTIQKIGELIAKGIYEYSTLF